MSVSLPNGATIALATTYGASKTITGISNASPPVVTTSAAHSISTGGIIEVVSGWTKITGRIFRAAAASASVLSLEGVDATSTVLYPAGTGAGTLREITAFTQISQILNLTTSGGDMQFANYSFLESDAENQIPTQASAQSMTIEIADDPALAGYIALKAASATRALTGLKVTMPGGSILLYNGYVSLNETPTMTKGSVMAVKATFSLAGAPTRYAS